MNQSTCTHCGEAIEPTGGKLYLWTHVDPNQQKCIVAQPVPAPIKAVKHTPGPWRVKQNYGLDNDTDIHGPINADKSSEYIATMSGCNDTPANARLIAAAPEMLEVLADVMGMLPVAARLHPDDLLKLQGRVIATIRKARGE